MHSPSDATRDAASARLILVGDALHNLIDGVLIAAAFLTEPRLGLVTTVAVFAHEIPQEVGDLAVLLNGGYTRQAGAAPQPARQPDLVRRRGDCLTTHCMAALPVSAVCACAAAASFVRRHYGT